MNQLPRILGIDPGSSIVGFACIAATCPHPLSPKHFRIADAGIIKSNPQKDFTARIADLHQALFELIAELKPTRCVIEKAFYGVNAASALKLGESRGALIAAISRHNIAMTQITPAQVKKMIAGQGRATKEQVYFALNTLLKFEKGKLPFDVSDALALALSYGLNMAASLKLDPPTARLRHYNY